MNERDLLNKSDSLNNNNDNNNLLNNLLNKYKSYLIKSFSVKAEFYPFFAKFLEKCEREHWDFSYAVNLAIKEFVDRHCVPNPQMTLERTLELGLPAKAHDVCCVPGCKRKAKFRKQLRSYDGKTEIFQVCEFHKRWRHKDFPFLISFKKLE